LVIYNKDIKLKNSSVISVNQENNYDMFNKSNEQINKLDYNEQDMYNKEKIN